MLCEYATASGLHLKVYAPVYNSIHIQDNIDFSSNIDFSISSNNFVALQFNSY